MNETAINFKDYAQAIGAVITSVAIILGGGWAFFKYVIRKEAFPRIEMSVDIKFIAYQKGQWIVEILCFLENKGLVPYTIEELSFDLRSLVNSDDLVEGDQNINSQLLFPNLIKKASWTPVNSIVEATLHPGISMRYNYVYNVPQETTSLLLHGILEYGKKRMQIRADRLVKVPNSLADTDNSSSS